MFPVVGEQRYSITESDGRDGYVCVGKRLAPHPPIAAQKTGLTSDIWCHRQAFEATQKGVRRRLFARTETCVDLGNANGATCEDVSFVNEVVEKCSAPIPPV